MKENLTKEERKMLLASIIESHFQEMEELHDKYGCANVEDLYFSEHRGSWIITFKKGEDQEFDTKEEAIEWIKAESAQS